MNSLNSDMLAFTILIWLLPQLWQACSHNVNQLTLNGLTCLVSPLWHAHSHHSGMLTVRSLTIWPSWEQADSSASAKCKSVQKPHTYLPDTPVDLTSAPLYFEMLPGPCGAMKRALRRCKSILLCSWKLQRIWRCIQNATRLDLEDIPIIEQRGPCAEVCGRVRDQLRPLCSSGGGLVPYFHSSGSLRSIRTRHFVYHISLCYSHKIHYLIIWHAIFKYCYIYTYSESGHRW